MSRRRFQNIQPLHLETLSLLKNPVLVNIKNDKTAFGEEIYDIDEELFDRTLSNVSSDDSLENLISEFRDLGNSKSSSSSLSWGSEYFNEASKQVRDELERMDRVLRGVEPIPPNYDREEYEEWMEFFPNLSVFGMTDNSSDTTIKSQEDCNVRENVPKVSNKLKTEVIDRIYKTNGYQKPRDAIINKISPFDTPREPVLRRQQSSRSLISSQITSSRWLKEEESAFDTLPFLKGGYGVKTVFSSRDRIRPTKGILKNALVLPPIEKSRVRSVSAIPTGTGKSLSTISLNGRAKNKIQVPIVRKLT